MLKKVTKLLVIFSFIFNSSLTFAGDVDEWKEVKARKKVYQNYHKLLAKTHKKATSILLKGKKLEKNSLKLLSKWSYANALKFEDLPAQNAKEALEFMKSPNFSSYIWDKILNEVAASKGSFYLYRKAVKKQRRRHLGCKLKKGSLYALTGTLYAGGIAGTVFLALNPAFFFPGPWIMGFLSLSAGSSWGTLTLIKGLSVKCKL